MGGPVPDAMHGLLPWWEPRDLAGTQDEYYRALLASPRAASRRTPLVDEKGRLNGPFNPFLTAPEAGLVLERLGTALRFPGRLPAVVFESVVLIVAAERSASYEWYAHAPLAADAGLSVEQIESARGREYAPLAQTVSPDLVELVLCTLDHREPAEQTVARLSESLGAGAVTEVVVTAAFYDLLASVMRTWRSPMPPDVADPFHSGGATGH